MLPERENLAALIKDAKLSGARLHRACTEAGISLRTYRRWHRNGIVQSDKRSEAERPTPGNKLSETEREAVVAISNEPEYASLPPSQVVPALLDKGIYLASESTFYRVLAQNEQVNHRGRSQQPKKKGLPTSHTAQGPNEVWSWDITYLPTRVRGMFYYLYLFEDIFSRKIVGYEVYDNECGDRAANLVQRSMLREQCLHKPLVLHSDNGAPMKALTMRAKLEELGVSASYSRPRVSNDNPYSEALFRTLKYRPNWPVSGFDCIEAARDWVQSFVAWYNNEHRHSKINFVTPAQRHARKDAGILSDRKAVLEAAKQAHPTRWSGSIRNCESVGAVTLNPEKPAASTKAVAA